MLLVSDVLASRRRKLAGACPLILFYFRYKARITCVRLTDCVSLSLGFRPHFARGPRRRL